VLARRARAVGNGGRLAGWLHGVATRVALRARDAAARRCRHEARAVLPAAADPANEVIAAEVAAVLDEQLGRLPMRYRGAFLLCCVEGQTRDQAARALGLALRTLDRRLEEGRALLRARLSRRGVTLSAALLTAGLMEPAAGAALPAPLVAVTVTAALAFVRGGTRAVGTSARAAVLAEAMLRGMVITSMKWLAAVVLVLGAVTAGAGLAVHAVGVPSPAVGQEDRKATPPKPVDVRQVRTDRYGDPLQEGAVARLGSVRLRHAWLSDFVVLPGGKAALTSGGDRVLRTWDLATGRQIRAVPLQGTAGPGNLVSLSPDGKTLAALDEGLLVFWDTESGRELKTLPGPKGQPLYLGFSPDGKTLAVGKMGWRVSLWEWETGKELEFPLPLRPRSGARNAMDSTFHGSFSPDNKWFVAGGSWQEPLGVFEVATGREVRRFTCHAMTSVVSPDSKTLAVSGWQNDKGGRETVLRLFNLASGEEVARFPQGHEEPYYLLAFSPDGNTLACGFSERSCLLDCATGRVLHRLSGKPRALAFTPDGKTLVGADVHSLRAWDVVSGEERYDRPGDFHRPEIAVSSDGRLLAAANWTDQAVSLWDTADGRRLRQLPLKDEQRYIRNLVFTPDGQGPAACQYKGILLLWDVATGKERRTVQLRDPAKPNPEFIFFYQFHLSPDGKRVSTLERVLGHQGEEGTRLAYWNTDTGDLLHQHTLPGKWREGAWLAGGAAVALPLEAGLTVLEVPTGATRFCLTGTPRGCPVVASPDGRLLAAPWKAGADRPDPLDVTAVGVWEAATGKRVAMVETDRVYHLALTPDNRSLVATDEKSLRVWDRAIGAERLRRPLPVAGMDSWGNTFVSRLLLSPDGRRAFTTLADGTALVWDLTPAPANGRGE
jgi:WD40 repeat protein